MSTLKELLAQREHAEARISEIMAMAAPFRERLAEIEEAIKIEIALPVAEARRLAAKDTGTVDVLVGGVMVKHCVDKRVVWDQEKLAALRAKIAAAGDEPDNYMISSTEYRVNEKAFKSFPDPVRAIFAEAREVKAGPPKITFDTNWRA